MKPPAQHKPFPGTTYNYMYPMIPQVPMAPVAMPSNGMQVPMQGTANTAAMGTDARCHDADERS